VSDDGADLGMTAQDGMEAALGSDEPKQERSPAEFRAMMGQVTVEQLRAILADLPPETRVWAQDDAGYFAIRSWYVDEEGLMLDQGL